MFVSDYLILFFFPELSWGFSSTLNRITLYGIYSIYVSPPPSQENGFRRRKDRCNIWEVAERWDSESFLTDGQLWKKEGNRSVIGRGTKGYKDGQLGHTEGRRRVGRCNIVFLFFFVFFLFWGRGPFFFFFLLYSVSYKMRRLRKGPEKKRFLFYNSTPKVVKCNCKGLLLRRRRRRRVLYSFFFFLFYTYIYFWKMFYKRKKGLLCNFFGFFDRSPLFFLLRDYWEKKISYLI